MNESELLMCQALVALVILKLGCRAANLRPVAVQIHPGHQANQHHENRAYGQQHG